ncbi:hypothetical protein OG357_01160 [Streptomyces sp. NBC_01255]|uniref:hypothetical protein n=1 Tax=Streptomyces sp. NBC_01255 TaxID=2903798 RepID=UPI002E32D27F|nr:hypothetical protein [Streptomyces sp. NBC_01255]
MTTASEPADRLAAFGNQLVDVHIWLVEELARLREEWSRPSTSSGRPFRTTSGSPT